MSYNVDMLWDIIRRILEPLFRDLINKIYVIAVVIPQATWDMRDEEEPEGEERESSSQSLSIVVMNKTDMPIKIEKAGVRFKDGAEVILSDFNLPLSIDAYDREVLTLKTDTFESLKGHGLGKIKYFYLESPLFNRFKAKLSKKEIGKLLVRYRTKEKYI